MSQKSTEHIPRVAIVLLAYNSLHLVQKFLPKIIATTPNDANHPIILADNASTDETARWMSENHPSIRVIQLKVNKGFTNGYQESLPQIKAHNYVLISSDIEVTPGWLEPALTLLESDDKIAAVQPKIKSYDRRDEFEYAGAAGGFMDKWGFPFCRGRIFDAVEKDTGQYDSQMQIFWASGACLFINARAYHSAGGLDNDYFAHFEEIDLCWRLQRMGYKIMYEPAGEVYHMGGSIIKYGSAGKVYRNHRNNLITILKNVSTTKLLYLIPLRFALDFAAAGLMLTQKNPAAAAAVFKAHLHFLLYLPKWTAKRKALEHLPRGEKSVYGIYQKSVVLDFFVRGKKKFSDLTIRF